MNKCWIIGKNKCEQLIIFFINTLKSETYTPVLIMIHHSCVFFLWEGTLCVNISVWNLSRITKQVLVILYGKIISVKHFVVKNGSFRRFVEVEIILMIERCRQFGPLCQHEFKILHLSVQNFWNGCFALSYFELLLSGEYLLSVKEFCWQPFRILNVHHFL